MPMVFRFELILKDTHGIVDDLTGEAVMEMADALYEAGCDDCTPGKSCGVIRVMFDREAESLEAAIRSAIRDVHSAGYQVDEARSDDQALFDQINQQLAGGSLVTS
jgi:hypothetical protein